jgi:hypothetical protein
MTYKKLLINTFFISTFFNHLHILSFIPMHNRPLLLLLFPFIIIFIHRYNVKVKFDLILWIILFFFIVFTSVIANIFFGYYDIYLPELISRVLSYLVLFYFFVIGIIFYESKELISEKFYYFLIIVGLLQVYTIFRLPFSNNIIYVFDNHLISSFSSISSSVLFFEAEPSYVAFMIIFIMVIYESKNMRIFVFLSFLTLSVRTTFVSILYFIKKHPIIYSLIIMPPIIIILQTTQLSYSVYYRVKALVTFQQLDPSTYIRVVNNKIALNMINDYPILGVGPGQYSSYYTGKYLSNYDTRRIPELENVLLEKTKNADPYSFILGLGSELGIFGLTWLIITGAFFLFKTRRKYLVFLLMIILMWGYPYGKPYVWIILGYIYQEYQLLKLNNRLN